MTVPKENRSLFIYSKDDSRRFVEYKGKKYENISTLLDEHTEVANIPLEVAYSINYICYGREYNLITDIDKYKSQFAQELAEEEQGDYPEGMPKRSSWGPFDVSQIQSPHWEKNTLVFFVERGVTRSPFRVVYSPKDQTIVYEALKK